MIRNEKEYQYSLERIADFEEQMRSGTQALRAQGLGVEDVDVALAGTASVLEDLKFECRFYERLKREGPGAVPDYPPAERGKALVALRIAVGRTQRELAEALSISEAQVSRDEKNEYRGVTQARYARVLQALGVEEHVAAYVAPKILSMPAPVLERQAASFRPDSASEFELKVEEA